MLKLLYENKFLWYCFFAKSWFLTHWPLGDQTEYLDEQLKLVIVGWSISCETDLRWISLDLTVSMEDNGLVPSGNPFWISIVFCNGCHKNKLHCFITTLRLLLHIYVFHQASACLHFMLCWKDWYPGFQFSGQCTGDFQCTYISFTQNMMLSKYYFA